MIKTPSAATVRRQENERRWLNQLYDMWEPGVEQSDISYLRVAEQLGTTPAPMQKAVQVFKRIGVLNTRLEYEHGRRGFWTLTCPRDEALARLAAYHAEEAETVHTAPTPPRQAVSPTSIDTELVASVGEDGSSPFEALRSLRKDEQEALIAAAKQYVDRKEMLASTVAQLERAGIHANTSAFEFRTDQRLEHIALVLPTIDRLRRTIESLETQIEAYRNNAKPTNTKLTELEEENLRLRRLVEDLTNRSVEPRHLVTAGD